MGQIGEGKVEVKRKMVFEGPEREWCIIVHSTRLETDKVDFGLRKMSIENKTHIKYVSFKNSTKADKIAGLKLNRLLNVRVKYERLEDVNTLAAVRYKGHRGILG